MFQLQFHGYYDVHALTLKKNPQAGRQTNMYDSIAFRIVISKIRYCSVPVLGHFQAPIHLDITATEASEKMDYGKTL